MPIAASYWTVTPASTAKKRTCAMTVYTPASSTSSPAKVAFAHAGPRAASARRSPLSAAVCVATPGVSAMSGVQKPTYWLHECRFECGTS